MKNKKFWSLILMAVLCMGLAWSCSDDDDNNAAETGTLTARHTLNVTLAEDNLAVADFYVIYTDANGDSIDMKPITTTSFTCTKSFDTFPVSTGYYIIAAPKTPATPKSKYNFRIAVSDQVEAVKGNTAETIGHSSAKADWTLSGYDAGKLDDYYDALGKYLSDAFTLYTLTKTGDKLVYTQKDLSKSVTAKYDGLQFFRKCLVTMDSTDASKVAGYAYGIALNPSIPDIRTIGVDSLEQAKAIFNSWMAPDAKALTYGDNITYQPTDEDGKSQGNIKFLVTPDRVNGELATVTFSDGASVPGITSLRFVLNSAWPGNSESGVSYKKGDKMVFEGFTFGEADRFLWSTCHVINGTSMQEFTCVNDASNGQPAYFLKLYNDKVHLNYMDYNDGDVWDNKYRYKAASLEDLKAINTFINEQTYKEYETLLNCKLYDYYYVDYGTRVYCYCTYLYNNPIDYDGINNIDGYRFCNNDQIDRSIAICCHKFLVSCAHRVDTEKAK